MVSLGRGLWLATMTHDERPVVSLSLPENDWTRVIEWAGRQPVGTHLLADPGHAWKFGTPLRYSGRDVFLEEVKDTAMAIYARPSAARVIERQAALGDFASLDAARARTLAARYGLDYLVIDRDLPLCSLRKRHSAASRSTISRRPGSSTARRWGSRSRRCRRTGCWA